MNVGAKLARSLFVLGKDGAISADLREICEFVTRTVKAEKSAA